MYKAETQAKTVENKQNTDVRIHFNDLLVYLCQHSLQQPAWYLTIHPVILQ